MNWEEYEIDRLTRRVVRGRRVDQRAVEALIAVGGDVRARIEAAVKRWKPVLHRRLRAVTQLGTADPAGMTYKVSVTDAVPTSVAKVLSTIAPDVLWAFGRRASMDAASSILSSTSEREALIELAGSGTWDAGSAEDLHRAGKILDRIAWASREVMTEAVGRILASDVDVLGSYNPHSHEISLQWAVIWIVAEHLRIGVEDLAVVVLAHELAHLYTQHGLDADGRRWAPGAFLGAPLEEVEGQAQFFTAVVLEGAADRGDRNPILAFHALMGMQSAAYTAWTQWPEAQGEGRVEGVRRRLIAVRGARR